MCQKLMLVMGIVLAGSGMIWNGLGEPHPMNSQKQKGQQDREQNDQQEDQPDRPKENKQDKDEDAEKTKKPKALDNTPFMTRKLDSARDVVSGLATEDFDLIAKSASDLNLLSHESQWEVYQTAEYVRFSSDFRDSAVRLRDAARDRNLDGATLAYFEVTLNCVRCHKYIRANPQ